MTDNEESKTPTESPTVLKKISNDGSEATTGFALGIAVVLIGLILLAKNLGYEFFFLHFQNWWAIFIMLAAIGPLHQAYKQYRRGGFNHAVANSLVSAGAIIFISLLFLLDLRWQVWWPVFVIVGGLYLMTNKR